MLDDIDMKTTVTFVVEIRPALIENSKIDSITVRARAHHVSAQNFQLQNQSVIHKFNRLVITETARIRSKFAETTRLPSALTHKSGFYRIKHNELLTI